MGNWFDFWQTSGTNKGLSGIRNLKKEEISLRDIEIGPKKGWNAPVTGIENQITDQLIEIDEKGAEAKHNSQIGKTSSKFIQYLGDLVEGENPEQRGRPMRDI